jgi:hypothetical protein
MTGLLHTTHNGSVKVATRLGTASILSAAILFRCDNPIRASKALLLLRTVDDHLDETETLHTLRYHPEGSRHLSQCALAFHSFPRSARPGRDHGPFPGSPHRAFCHLQLLDCLSHIPGSPASPPAVNNSHRSSDCTVLPPRQSQPERTQRVPHGVSARCTSYFCPAGRPRDNDSHGPAVVLTIIHYDQALGPRFPPWSRAVHAGSGGCLMA